MTPRLPPDNARGAVPLGRRDLEALRAFSTPSVCDAIAELAPERRGWGFTTEPLFAARPGLPPVVGHVRTASVRTAAPSGSAAVERDGPTAWLAHLAGAPKPAIALVQDLDAGQGRAACCGRVLAHMHAALGCIGMVTDGALRDLPRLPADFQLLAAGVRPSRGWLRWVGLGGPVMVAGMQAADGDIVHADANGAVIVPAELVRDLPAHIARMRAADADLLAECRRPGVDFTRLRAVLAGRRSTRWCP